MDKVIGTCSLCGGAVVVFEGPWGGTVPPTPSCRSCHAESMEGYGPVIAMKPRVRPAPQHVEWCGGKPYSVRFPSDPLPGCDEMGPFIR